MFVTAENENLAANLIRLLDRFRGKVPEKLFDLESRSYMTQEHNKAQTASLCPYFKAFGYCRSGKFSVMHF